MSLALVANMVEVTRTVPLESLVWAFRKDPYNERQKQTLDRWKKEFGIMEVDQAKQLKEL
jgi:hypothetical protein